MTAHALPTFRLPENARIPQAMPQTVQTVTLESPGPDVMTDLTLVKASTIDSDADLVRTELAMIHQGVRMLFVVSNFPFIVGLVTSNDLIGDKPMRLVHQRNVHHDELVVADVMTELSQIDALDYDNVRLSTVGQLVATFRQCGRKHMLVLQQETPQSQARIRGVISLTQLERQLGSSVDTSEIAVTFAEIEKALA